MKYVSGKYFESGLNPKRVRYKKKKKITATLTQMGKNFGLIKVLLLKLIHC